MNTRSPARPVARGSAVVALALGLAAVVGAAPAATAPADAGTRPRFDEATPVGALRALEAALAEGNEGRILSLARAPAGTPQRALREKARAWAQVHSFYDALYARFDRRAVNESFPGLGLMFATRWIDLDRAAVRVDGDTAVIEDGSGAGRRQAMVREAGRWKAYFFADENDPAVRQELDRLIAQAGPLAEAMAETRPEVRAGRYETPQEVSRVLTERAELAERAAAGRPADDRGPRTRPAGRR